MLYFFFWLEALLGGVGIYFLANRGFHPLWLLPITVGLFVALCLLYLLFLYVSGELLPKKNPDHVRPFAAHSIRVALHWFMRVFCVSIKVQGAEKLPKDTPVVLVCNHRSALDPVFIICGLRRRKIAFVAKESVMKYPIVGPYARRAGFLGIDRESPMQAMRTIHRAARFIREDGVDYGIFPEGTRSRTEALLPFKSGAFLMAKKADSPIAILTMEGSAGVIRGLPFHRPKIRLTVCEVIGVDEVRAKTHEELSARVRGVMEDYFDNKEQTGK